MKAARAAGEEAPQGARPVKVVLVGDGGCGKTSLLMVFAEGNFPEVSAGALATATRGLPCVPSVRELPRMCAHAGLAGSPSTVWGSTRFSRCLWEGGPR